MCLQLVDEEARSVSSGLLNRHPVLLYADPHKVTAIVQVLVQATRQRNLMRPWFMQDAQILAIVDRWVALQAAFPSFGAESAPTRAGRHRPFSASVLAGSLCGWSGRSTVLCRGRWTRLRSQTCKCCGCWVAHSGPAT
jgi:hypothetical protein